MGHTSMVGVLMDLRAAVTIGGGFGGCKVGRGLEIVVTDLEASTERGNGEESAKVDGFACGGAE